MGKYETYHAIEVLGGKATGAEIRHKLIELYPLLSYHQFYPISLKRLIKEGLVDRKMSKGRRGGIPVFRIRKPYGERNVVIVGKNGSIRRVNGVL